MHHRARERVLHRLLDQLRAGGLVHLGLWFQGFMDISCTTAPGNASSTVFLSSCARAGLCFSACDSPVRQVEDMSNTKTTPVQSCMSPLSLER